MPNKVERIKTNYPGVYYIMSKATDGRPEKIYYIFYRKGGKQIEEKAGRQFQNDMTPARAARIRAQRIEGCQQSGAPGGGQARGMDRNPVVAGVQCRQANNQEPHHG
jgi:hypothetical protein